MSISKEAILAKVNSYEILNHYLQPFHEKGPRLNYGVNISNPLLPDKQATPSFNICKPGTATEWIYHDFATGDTGSCFDLVMNLFKLTFFEALQRINIDFNLKLDEPILVAPIEVFTSNVERDKYSYTKRNFNLEELKFWFKYGITNDQLKLYNVLAIESYSSVTKDNKPYTCNSTIANPVYGYAHDSGIKLYKPLDKKFRFLHLGIKPANFIFGLEQLPAAGAILFITGGEKDVITLSAHGFNAIALNSETASLPKEIVASLKSRFTQIIVLYDNDETGIKQSAKLANENKLQFIILPTMPNGKDISDFFLLGNQIDDFNKLIPEAPISPLNTFLKSFDELAKQGANLPELKQVFGNFILEQSTVLFPSERGVGKTYFMMQLAIAIANCDTHFCGEPLQMHGNTLYINLELGERLMMRRTNKLFKNYKKNTASPYKAYCISFRNSLKENLDKVTEAIKLHKPVLVIIDNLRSAFKDNDNEKNKEMANIFMGLNQLKDDNGFSFVIVHHTKKGSTNKLTDSDLQSGAGAITDLVDADYFLRKSKQDKNYRILKRIKSRECEEQEGAKLIRFNPDTLWFEFVQDNVEEKEHIYEETNVRSKEDKKEIAFTLHNKGQKLQQIADEVGVDKSTISRWLNKPDNDD